jgi:hypothetical protein
MVLAGTGAIRGHVFDAAGKPLGGIKLSLHGEGASFPPMTSTAEGGYELGQLKPVVQTITLNSTGWLTAKHADVAVREGLVTEDVDFHLEPAPSISWVVVDPKVAPLAYVRLNGLAEGGGFGAEATTDSAGSFVMSLPAAATYCLYLIDQHDFEPWDVPRPERIFEPGAKDVRIVLTPVVSTTFRVVDAASGSPIERYGIRIEPELTRNGSDVSFEGDSVQIEPHAKGEAVLPAKPGHANVQVRAAGHGPADLRVKWDDPDRALQTVRLEIGGSLRGQVAFAGRMIADAKVKLSEDPGRREPGDRTPRLTLFTGRDQVAATDGEGRFEFHDLAAGIYQVTIDPSVAARVTQGGIHVQPGATTDLGAIVPDVGATIRVHVRVAPGVDASELKVITGPYGDRRAVRKADGILVFNGMEAGTHELTLVRHPPLVPEAMKQKVTIATGETRDVEFDLVPHEPCKVTVHVTQNGEAVGFVHVRAQLMSNGFVTKEIDVGTTSDEGVAAGTCPGDSDVRFVARSAKGVFLGQAPADIHLPASGSHEDSLALATGELTVQLPARSSVPERGNVDVTLAPVSPAGAAPIELRAATKTSFDGKRGSAEWTSTLVVFGDVAAGEYEVLVNVHRFDPDARGKANNWTRTDVVPPFKTKIVLEAGKSNAIVVP